MLEAIQQFDERFLNHGTLYDLQTGADMKRGVRGGTRKAASPAAPLMREAFHSYFARPRYSKKVYVPPDV